MGGLPCRKVIINSIEIKSNLDKLIFFAEGVATGEFPSDVLDYKTTEKLISELDEITAKTKTFADAAESRFRKHLKEND